MLQRDVAAAFAYHAQDLVAMTSEVTGLPAIPEQRYYEKVSLEG